MSPVIPLHYWNLRRQAANAGGAGIGFYPGYHYGGQGIAGKDRWDDPDYTGVVIEIVDRANGSDSTGDGSVGNPWRTLNKGMLEAQASTRAGFRAAIQLRGDQRYFEYNHKKGQTGPVSHALSWCDTNDSGFDEDALDMWDDFVANGGGAEGSWWIPIETYPPDWEDPNIAPAIIDGSGVPYDNDAGTRPGLLVIGANYVWCRRMQVSWSYGFGLFVGALGEAGGGDPRWSDNYQHHFRFSEMSFIGNYNDCVLTAQYVNDIYGQDIWGTLPVSERNVGDSASVFKITRAKRAYFYRSHGTLAGDDARDFRGMEGVDSGWHTSFNNGRLHYLEHVTIPGASEEASEAAMTAFRDAQEVDWWTNRHTVIGTPLAGEAGGGKWVTNSQAGGLINYEHHTLDVDNYYYGKSNVNSGSPGGGDGIQHNITTVGHGGTPESPQSANPQGGVRSEHDDVTLGWVSHDTKKGKLSNTGSRAPYVRYCTPSASDFPLANISDDYGITVVDGDFVSVDMDDLQPFLESEGGNLWGLATYSGLTYSHPRLGTLAIAQNTDAYIGAYGQDPTLVLGPVGVKVLTASGWKWTFGPGNTGLLDEAPIGPDLT